MVALLDQLVTMEIARLWDPPVPEHDFIKYVFRQHLFWICMSLMSTFVLVHFLECVLRCLIPQNPTLKPWAYINS